MSTSQSSLKVMLSLLFVVFIDSMGAAIIFPILTPVFMTSDILPPDTSMHVRTLLYGVSMCMFPLAMFFSTPILGELSDFIGRKKVLLICLVGICASYCLSSIAIIACSVSLLIISRLMSGLFAGSVAIAQAAIIDVSAPEKKATNLGLMLVPSSVGWVAGPLLGGFSSDNNLVSWFGLWTPLTIGAILAFINIIYLSYVFKETHPVKKAFDFQWHRGIQIFTDAFRNKTIRLLSICFLGLQLGWSLYFQYISVFLLKKYHYTSNHIGMFIAMIGLGFGIALFYLIKLLTKHFSNKTIVLWSLIISAISLLFTAISWQVFIVWIAGFVLAIGMAVAYPVIISMYSNLVGEDKQGWIMGVANAVIGFAWALTGFAGSFLQNINDTFAMILATVFMACAVVLVCFYRKQT